MAPRREDAERILIGTLTQLDVLDARAEDLSKGAADPVSGIVEVRPSGQGEGCSVGEMTVVVRIIVFIKIRFGIRIWLGIRFGIRIWLCARRWQFALLILRTEVIDPLGE